VNPRPRNRPYADRTEAGRELAQSVESYFRKNSLQSPPPTAHPPEIVLGLCRGGVPVAAQVALHLKLPLDLLVVRKIAHTTNPELALGAVAETGALPVAVLNEDLLQHASEIQLALDAARARAEEDLHSRTHRYRTQHRALPLNNLHVLLVDDGAATGASVRAGIRAARARGARSISVALPVAPHPVINELTAEVDAVICPWCPDYFTAVGCHYRHFPQVSDEEVLALLSTVREKVTCGPSARAQPSLKNGAP
jgi:predicted phosphoribosyltransferase